MLPTEQRTQKEEQAGGRSRGGIDKPRSWLLETKAECEVLWVVQGGCAVGCRRYRSGAPVPCMDGRHTSRVTAAGGQQRGTQRKRKG